MTAEQWVSLIVERAADLRAAGVQRISVNGASVVLLPADHEMVATATKIPPGPAEHPLLDPFDDPETFGGVLPGYEFPASPPEVLE